MLSSLLLFTILAAAQAVLPGGNANRTARLPGALEFGNENTADVVRAPESVGVNESFQITVSTFGNGCLEAGDIDAILTASGATVLVYDLTSAVAPGILCTAVIKRLPHTVSLRFDKPGQALVRIWGRRIGADTPPLGLPLIIEKRITVR